MLTLNWGHQKKGWFQSTQEFLPNQQSTLFLDNRVLSTQWQAFPFTPAYQSVSFLVTLCLHSLPDSSPSTLWCYLLLQPAIIPSAPQHIFFLLHSLLDAPLASLSRSLIPSPALPVHEDRWVTAELNVSLSDRGHTDALAAGRTPGDNRWLHVPAASAWWLQRWARIRFLCMCAPDERRPLILVSHLHSATAEQGRSQETQLEPGAYSMVSVCTSADKGHFSEKTQLNRPGKSLPTSLNVSNAHRSTMGTTTMSQDMTKSHLSCTFCLCHPSSKEIMTIQFHSLNWLRQTYTLLYYTGAKVPLMVEKCHSDILYVRSKLKLH